MTEINKGEKQREMTANKGQSMGLVEERTLPQDLIKAHGLGAHMPPVENKGIQLSLEDGVSHFYRGRGRNCYFFEGLLMQILIYWLLMWLFVGNRF